MAEVTGGCHCGAVRFSATLLDGLNTARRCTCSYCRMKGAVAVTLADDGFQLQSGADVLSEYRFNSGVAAHYFCSICGIGTHHSRRSTPGQLAVNAACLDGVSPFDFPEVQVLDGQSHPSDTGVSRRAGTLIYKAE